MTATAYPLQWPDGWPRTPRKEGSAFKTTLPQALAAVQKELKLMGATSVVISSNVTLTTQRPAESGVAVYFTLQGDQHCIPCERYVKIEDNLQAIAKTINALRGIERWGAKHMVKAAFRGFQALPDPGRVDWRDVFGWEAGVRPTLAAVESVYKRLRSDRHPDRPGGSAAEFDRVQRAWDMAKKELELTNG